MAHRPHASAAGRRAPGVLSDHRRAGDIRGKQRQPDWHPAQAPPGQKQVIGTACAPGHAEANGKYQQKINADDRDVDRRQCYVLHDQPPGRKQRGMDISVPEAKTPKNFLSALIHAGLTG